MNSRRLLLLIATAGLLVPQQERMTPIEPPPPGNPAQYWGGSWVRKPFALPKSPIDQEQQNGSTNAYKVHRHWEIDAVSSNAIRIQFRLSSSGPGNPYPGIVNSDVSYACIYTFNGMDSPINLPPDQYKDVTYSVTASSGDPKKECSLKDPRTMMGETGYVRSNSVTGPGARTYVVSTQFRPEAYTSSGLKPTKSMEFSLGFKFNLFPDYPQVIKLEWEWRRDPSQQKTLGSYSGATPPTPPGGRPIPGEMGRPGGTGGQQENDDCTAVCPNTRISLLCVDSDDSNPGAAISDACKRCRENNKCGEEAAVLLNPKPGGKLQDVKVPWEWSKGGNLAQDTQLEVKNGATGATLYAGPWGKSTSATIEVPANAALTATVRTRFQSGRTKERNYVFQTEEEAGLSPAFMAPNTDVQGQYYRTQGAPSADSCRLQCVGDKNCKAYTYRQPAASCELKSTALSKSIDNCCVSGMRGSLAALPLAGSNQPPPPNRYPPQPPTLPPPRVITLPPAPPGLPRQARAFKIVPSRVWSDTGIDVQPGMELRITASGTVELGGGVVAGPAGTNTPPAGRLPVPDAPPGALIAKLVYRTGGESGVVIVGTQNTLTVEAGEFGRLLLGVNDDRPEDNRGEFVVRINW